MPLSIPGGPLLLGRKGGLQIKGSSFTPAQIAGLKAWYKADAITGLADAAAVASWLDSATAGFGAATQGTGANQPIYKTGILNGKPVVRFASASAQYLQTVNVTQAQPVTCFAVAQATGAAATNTIYSGTANTCRLYRNGTSTMSLYSGSAVTCTLAINPTLAFNVYSSVFNGASSENRLNGGTAATGSPGASGISAARFQIGAAANIENWNGDIAEIIWYSGVLSASDRLAVERYLGAKYAITVA